ncbi:dipeptidase [Sorangium sp. So ce385]|uniref:dipeptidase n=1 Tax=Sorangium sp. So ce385 TaxID=3133308 RepID=UPI003F5B6BE2
MRTLSRLALLAAAALAACAPPAPPATPLSDAPAAEEPWPGAATAPGAAEGPAAPESPEQRAARLRAAAILVDGHNGIPSPVVGGRFDVTNLSREAARADLARLKAAGVAGELFPIHVGALSVQQAGLRGGAARRALDLIDGIHRQIERHGADLVLARSARDVRRAKREGRVAALMGIEGGHAIENSLSALRSFHRLGVRYMALTHLSTNDWADSAGGALEPAIARHRGLSPFGEEVVREMQRIGMLVDVSHASEATFRAVLRVAKAPIIASSSVRAEAHHRRRLGDDLLRALATNGGVAMVDFWALFLDEAYAEQAGRFLQKHGARLKELSERAPGDAASARGEIEKLRAQEAPIQLPPSARIADHIDDLVKIAGVDHVALGSDFDVDGALPGGLAGIDGRSMMALELVRRGYSDEDILKLLGGNFLRIFEQAEAYAASTETSLSGDGSTRQLTAAELPSAAPEPAAAVDPRPLLPPPGPSPPAPAVGPKAAKPASPPAPPGGMDLIMAR